MEHSLGASDLDCVRRESRVTQFRLPSVIRAVLRVIFHISFRMDVSGHLLDVFHLGRM